MIVDDDAGLRTYMRLALQLENFRVLDFASARDALWNLAIDSAVSAVISDVEMPDLNGIAFAHIVRGGYPHLPFLLMSGHPIDCEGCEFPFLAKPFSHQTLIQRVNLLVAEHSAERYPLARAS